MKSFTTDKDFPRSNYGRLINCSDEYLGGAYLLTPCIVPKVFIVSSEPGEA